MRLSALLVVKNEEAIVRKALDSVRLFDEIVVVDTGSTDDTLEIVKDYPNAAVHHFTWCDDFAAARNYAIEKATGDWCFSIDADHELLSPLELVHVEAARLDRAGHKAGLVHSDLGGGGSAWREVLFKRDPSVRWHGKVHEVLLPATAERTQLKRRCGYSDNHKLDPDRNLRILKASADTQRTRFYLGREHFDRKQYADAIAHMRRYLAEPARWMPEIVEAWLTIAKSHWFSGRGADARTAALEALRHNPDCGEALRLLALYHDEPWRSKWLALSKHATNRDVLFIRE